MAKRWFSYACMLACAVLIAFGVASALSGGGSESEAKQTQVEPTQVATVEASPMPSVGVVSESPTFRAGCEPTDLTVESGADGRSYLARFTGAPATPRSLCGASRLDVQVHSRDRSTWYQLEAMDAQHGPACEAPPAVHPHGGSYEAAVFQCRDHLMTAINAGGYGEIVLTPDVMADFSSGTAVISWDISTLRMSGRDWFDVWLTPFAENLPLPLQEWLPDLNGPPRNAVHVGGNGRALCPEIFREFKDSPLVPGYGNGCNWGALYDTILTASATVRTTFRVEVSQTHLKVWIPPQPSTNNRSLVWFDGPIPGGLPFDKAVVQFAHHSYTPDKADGCDARSTPCQAGTWHWDNISVSPGIPFTMIKADRRFVNAANTRVTFSSPAPDRSYLRFSGHQSVLEASFNGGPFQTLQEIPTKSGPNGDFGQFFVPVPVGTRSVEFRGKPGWTREWILSDFAIWVALP